MESLTVLSPLGARVDDIEVDALSEADTDRCRQLLGEHGVVVFTGQDADDHSFLRFLKSFGELAFTVGETPVPTSPELNVISNVGRTTPPRSNFHVDTSYVQNPPPYTALRAVTVPDRGGQTLFSNQYTAYDTLPEHLRTRLAGRSITHVVTGLDLGPDDETSADHPIFAVHPITGRTSLYMSTPARSAAISGMSGGETADIVAQLYAHSTAANNVYRHQWKPRDVVMWDNRCVMHRADHAGVVGDRVMHRGMVSTR